MTIENKDLSAKEVLDTYENQAPFADVLVLQFLNHADSETIVVETGPDGPVVMGDVGDDSFIASLRISQMGKDRVSLEVFAEKAGMQSVQLAQFRAEELRTGIGFGEQGDELTYGIHFSLVIGGLYLHSTRNEWLMDFASGMAHAASEAYDYKQPRFFHSDERPDPVRNE